MYIDIPTFQTLGDNVVCLLKVPTNVFGLTVVELQDFMMDAPSVGDLEPSSRSDHRLDILGIDGLLVEGC